MMTLTVLSLSVAYLLYVWFETDAFTAYCNLFLGFFPEKLMKYLDLFKTWAWSQSKDLGNPDYLAYLRKYSSDTSIKKFLIKSITCPTCLSFWIALVLSAFFNLQLVFASAFLGSCAYMSAAYLHKRIG